jgi:hypothetical protein
MDAIDTGNLTQKRNIINGVERVTNIYELNGTRVYVSDFNGYIVSANPY